MAAYDDLNVKRIFIAGIASIVVTAVTALAVQVVYYWLAEMQESETRAASDYTRQLRILAEQQAEIETLGVDEETGNFVVPVQDAMAYLVEQAKKSSSNAMIVRDEGDQS